MDKKLDAELVALQVAVYMACGGKGAGEWMATTPKTFMHDPRLGKMPYSLKAINKLRDALIEYAENKGYDPENLPRFPHIPWQ